MTEFNLTPEEQAHIERIRQLRDNGEDGEKAISRAFATTERAIVRANKDALMNDATYVAAKQRESTMYQTWNRTRNKLIRNESEVDNPKFDAEQPTSDENPEKITVERNWYENRLASLQEQMDAVQAEYDTAADDVFEGDDERSEGRLHQSMRESKERRIALENKLLGIRPTAESADPAPAEGEDEEAPVTAQNENS